MKTAMENLIEQTKAIRSGHLVYNGGEHGTYYIDKERFCLAFAGTLQTVIEQAAVNAIRGGLFVKGERSVGVIGPAFGAIPYAFSLACVLEKYIYGVRFFSAHTELEVKYSGRKMHVIPRKLLGMYEGKSFIILKDIVNAGTTIKEVSQLLRVEAKAQVLAAICLVDRGGQTAESLGIEKYFPLHRVKMEKHDPRSLDGCPLCKAGMPITLDLGKGKEWVNLFGQPPYPENQDFSEFWPDSEEICLNCS